MCVLLTLTLNVQPEDLYDLNVIHVAGTKGKGSTCAFINSLLQRAKPEWRVGKVWRDELRKIVG